MIQTLIKSDILTKYYRRKNNYSGHEYFLVDIIETLPFGKCKVNLFYHDMGYPYFWSNYIGTTIVEEINLKTIENECK